MAARFKWGRSSVGRAPALQAGGQEFESLRLHRKILKDFATKIINAVSAGRVKSKICHFATSSLMLSKAKSFVSKLPKT